MTAATFAVDGNGIAHQLPATPVEETAGFYYLSGPMTGKPEHNFPAFNEAAEALRANGYVIFNPAESFDGRTDLNYYVYLRHDIEHVARSRGLVLIEGWEDSPGARFELEVARRLDLPVFLYHPTISHGSLWRFEVEDQEEALAGCESVSAEQSETILEEARRLVHGDRGADYGHPFLDFERTAGMLTALLAHKLKPGERFTAQDWSMGMILAKLSREVNRPKRDNRVDVAGYVETLDMVESYREGMGA